MEAGIVTTANDNDNGNGENETIAQCMIVGVMDHHLPKDPVITLDSGKELGEQQNERMQVGKHHCGPSIHDTATDTDTTTNDTTATVEVLASPTKRIRYGTWYSKMDNNKDNELDNTTSTSTSTTTSTATSCTSTFASNKNNTGRSKRSVGSSLEELRRFRCGKCYTCRKPDCQACWTCRNVYTTGTTMTWIGWKPVCLQKICCNFDHGRRVQPIPGFPQGWGFCFQDPSMESCANKSGLTIVSPNGNCYWSLNDYENNDIDDDTFKGMDLSLLYSHLGATKEEDLVIVDPSLLLLPQSPSIDTTTTNTTTLKHTNHESNISFKDDVTTTTTTNIREIGSRVYCRWPKNGNFYWGMITNVVMMDNNTTSKSPRYTVEFDDGDIIQNIGEWTKGNILNMYTEAEYHEGTGIMPPPIPSHFQKRRDAYYQQGSKDDAPVIVYSPAMLFQKRCNKCSLCQSENCGRCETCRSRDSATSPLDMEVCLRKMCARIPLAQKAQAAAGLQAGWRFVFCNSKVKAEESLDSLIGLRLVSPTGRTFGSLEEVLYKCGQKWDDWDSIRDAFYRQIGASILRKENDHFLVGLRYCQEWTDLDGQNKIVYGTVTECERNDMDNSFYQFTVVFDDRSRTLANTVRNRCGSRIPTLAKLSLPWALGGCNNYDQKLSACPGTTSLFHDIQNAVMANRWSWITPEMRIEELVSQMDGNHQLPRLTMVVRGFQLTFSARISGIPNAGYGVFVSCVSFSGADTFVLAPGEILDIGVYAPFRKEDRKHATVFLVKNYIHNLKCEEWAFDTIESGLQFDITDDETGNLHELAKSHIPAYVNECGPDSVASVKAEHDPEGNVHYLLGVADGSTFFSLPADDSQHEIFINYGPVYEHVRVRKGYSTLPPEDLAKHQRKEEDTEYMSEILDMEKNDIHEVLAFLLTLFPVGRVSCNDVQMLRRTLTVTALLQCRAKTFADPCLDALADSLLTTLLHLRMDEHLLELRGSASFCYEVVKDQLDGTMSEALHELLSKLH